MKGNNLEWFLQQKQTVIRKKNLPKWKAAFQNGSLARVKFIDIRAALSVFALGVGYYENITGYYDAAEWVSYKKEFRNNKRLGKSGPFQKKSILAFT